MKTMSFEEYQKYWDKAAENPFTLIDLPSGAKMVSNYRDVFVLFDTKEGRMQAKTRGREWFGCVWEIENYKEFPNEPRKWKIKPAEYCSI
ncbi:MAG: hypothetical protein K6T73_01245 [Candidatus Bathyarchaeota archaeon]|nr:hypothetical protein [Candidatus Bathyarchaeota archaeon]